MGSPVPGGAGREAGAGRLFGLGWRGGCGTWAEAEPKTLVVVAARKEKSFIYI